MVVLKHTRIWPTLPHHQVVFLLLRVAFCDRDRLVVPELFDGFFVGELVNLLYFAPNWNTAVYLSVEPVVEVELQIVEVHLAEYVFFLFLPNFSDIFQWAYLSSWQFIVVVDELAHVVDINVFGLVGVDVGIGALVGVFFLFLITIA